MGVQTQHNKETVQNKIKTCLPITGSKMRMKKKIPSPKNPSSLAKGYDSGPRIVTLG